MLSETDLDLIGKFGALLLKRHPGKTISHSVSMCSGMHERKSQACRTRVAAYCFCAPKHVRVYCTGHGERVSTFQAGGHSSSLCHLDS